MGGRRKSSQPQPTETRSLESVFGEIVRERRLRLNLSQRELSILTDLERSTVAYIELGSRQPSLRTIIELARALGVRPSELLREVEERMNFQQR